MEKIVIVGGVAAGATAAAKARRISANAEITLLEGGPDISFANCGLPYYIGGDIKSRSKLILQSPESFNEQYNVDVHINTVVDKVDSSNKIVNTIDAKTGEKKTFEYTKLILAQGGRPIKPNLPGANQNHVFTLWTLEDMDKIDNFIKNQEPQTAVVVGGGFIGLEMVEALVKRGIKVSVVEMMPHVMAIMEAETAGFIESELHAYGVGVQTSTGITEIYSNSVKLDNGKTLDADMVLLSTGVRPTIQLAKDAGLALGEAGGLLVNSKLETSVNDIYAAGDMVEIEHRVNNKKVRIPLAGPANRQGRIAAENALGGNHEYKGALGTSVVRVFEAVAGTTGLSLKQAKKLGYNADAVVVHKEHHTAYYPGAENVTVMLIFDKKTGIIMGGQTAGYKGADKRLDVIATAAASKLTIYELADIDFAYSPPIGTANDALNMAAYAAENKLSGFSPSVTVGELDEYLEGKQAIAIDVRDVFAFEKSHIQGANHIALELLPQYLSQFPKDKTVLVYDEYGKKGHQALRMLKGAGIEDVVNISGGHISMQRYQQAVGFKNFTLNLLPIEKKSIHEEAAEETVETEKEAAVDGPLIVDVRTREEFAMGAVPEALNIPLDELQIRIDEFGAKDRNITMYCASGARSSYAVKMMRQLGYTNAKNGGGVANMMAKYKTSQSAKEEVSTEPIIVDVRTREEFAGGAYPGAINIPLDELEIKASELGSHAREITLYCASGARSSYGVQVLQHLGFSHVKNGGGIMQMMRNR